MEGEGRHLTYTRREVVLSPYAFVTLRETAYVPGVVNVWEGFLTAEVWPSPKFQSQAKGALKDMSVNWTVIGANPILLLIMKKEMGARPGIMGGTGVAVAVGDIPEEDVATGWNTVEAALTQT